MLGPNEVLSPTKWNGLVGELKILDLYAHRVFIAEDGKLGIGTTAPGSGLHLLGEGDKGVAIFERKSKKLIINPNLNQQNQFAEISTAKASNMGLQLSVNAQPALTIDVQKNVDIGASLSVGGSIQIETSGTKYPADNKKLALITSEIDKDSRGFKFSWRKDNGDPRIDALQFDTNGNVYLSNNVGIGTTAPAAKLHVNGNAKVGTLNADAVVATSMKIAKIEIGAWVITQEGANLKIANGANTAAIIEPSGNIKLNGKTVIDDELVVKRGLRVEGNYVYFNGLEERGDGDFNVLMIHERDKFLRWD